MRGDVQDVLDFWFAPAVQPLWFNSTPEFDQTLATRFSRIYAEGQAGRLDAWQDHPEGVLALVIVLDQFPLNMFRKRPESFATEAAARAVARNGIAQQFDMRLRVEQRLFVYLPFMHSEDLADQDYSVELFERLGTEQGAHYARHHREIIRKFGRFPHRNSILGRPSTPQEIEYLNSPEAFLG